MNEFVFKNQKKLRCGLTTGTCAAACAQAAMLRLLTGKVLSEVMVRLPESRKRVQESIAGVSFRDEISEDRENCGTQHDSDGMSQLQQAGSVKDSTGSSTQLVTLSVYPTTDGGFATRKNAGDDPDVTNGTEIRAYVQVCDVASVPYGAFMSMDGRLYLTGGMGVGRVTKPGLEQAVGQSAINRVPRQMIFDAVQQVLEDFGEEEKLRMEGIAAEDCTSSLAMEDRLKHTNGKPDAENIGAKFLSGGNEKSERAENPCYLITISVPAGAELAQRTFNPMLGIEGGISILGTTGIVEPMSEAAIVATIESSIRQVLAMEDAAVSGTDEAAVWPRVSASHGKQTASTDSGRKEDGDIGRRARRILAVPGNYGQRYVEQQLGLRGVPVVEVSNYIGEAIDLAVSYGATDFLLVGNVGKLVKLAAGIMNTHSRVADGRWEIFAAHLALCGGTRAQVAAMREATTTEEMLTRLEEMGLRVPVMASIMGEIEAHMAHRIRGQMDFGVIVYSERFGRVGETAGAERLLVRAQMQGDRYTLF